MKRTDVEHLVRQMAWPEPPASLRERVLSDTPIAEQPIAGAARVAGSQDPARRPHIVHENARSGHGWRRAGVLVSLGLLLTFGSCTSLDVWANKQIEAELARIEARFGSLNEKTRVPAVPPADNRAPMVRAAAALAVRAAEPTYSYLHRPSFPVPAGMRAFADANRAAIRLAGEIRTRRQSNWEIDRSQGVWPPFDAIDILSNAIFVTALLDMQAGDPDDAASLIVSGLGIAASMRQEPDLIAQSHRTSDVASQQVEAIRQLVTTSAPSKAALKELAWWLAENRMPDGMRPAMLNEMKWSNAVFERMEHGDVDEGLAANIYPMTWPKWPSAFLGLAAQVGRPFVRTARLRYLQHMERLLDAEMGSRPRVEVREPRTPRWALIDRLTEKFVDGSFMFSYVGDGFVSELGAAELAVALRRFKLDHNNYPNDLSAVVPVYLSHVPINPYTGQPPVYTRLGAGFTLRAAGSSPGMEKYRALVWNVPK